jgi:hypothetical protein
MPTVRRIVLHSLSRGDVVGASPLTDVHAIGPYLEGRLRRALRRAGPVTVQQFWTALRRKTPAQAARLLQRALQNRRGNQCVSPRSQTATHDSYHTGDVNRAGYEACAALLEHAGHALPRTLPPQSPASKACGCLDDCTSDPRCITARDGACVPRAHNARGFVGVDTHPDQRVDRTVAGNGPVTLHRTRVGPAHRNDPDAAQDIARGHARTLRYSPRGGRLWRRPGPKVRTPAR